MPFLDLPEFSDKIAVKPAGRVLIGYEGDPRAWITVTTVFSYHGGGYVMTCGHERGDTLFDGDTQVAIAAVAVNLLEADDPVDMAVFRVTEARVRFKKPQFFTANANYPRIGEGRVHTAKGERVVKLTSVDDTSAHMQDLIGARAPLSVCLPCVGHGDSGAPLHQIGAGGEVQLVGLHSGNDFKHSYFTPVRDALARALGLLP